MWGARKKSGWGVSWTISEFSASTPTSGRLHAAQDEREWRRTAEQGAEHFMAKWMVAEKAKAGLRHAVVCPNVMGRTKKRIAQSKRACAGSLALFTSHKWRELISSGRLVCRCHGVFLWCYVFFCFASFSSLYFR